MKKKLAILRAGVIVLAMLAGCGSSGSDTAADTAEETTAEESPEESAEADTEAEAAVSYTHLDVYKRQESASPEFPWIWM